jgi:hypothetical protein
VMRPAFSSTMGDHGESAPEKSAETQFEHPRRYPVDRP